MHTGDASGHPSDWHTALRRGEFVLHYQAKRALAGERVIGTEALLRWQHPALGLLGPGAVLAAAEQAQAIEQLGAWVMDRACEQLSRWRREGHPDWTMAVNVSPRQLLGASFVADVIDPLRRHHLAPGSLTLEITESEAMHYGNGCVERLRLLAQLGVRISLDDFGAGFSNLARLKHLPLHELKIDRSLIADLGRDKRADAIVMAIIELAHSLGLLVVAEGIEHGEQQACLMALGCDVGQGYWLGRPLPPERFWTTASLPQPIPLPQRRAG